MHGIGIGQKWKKNNASFWVKVIEVHQDHVIVVLVQPGSGELQAGPTIIRIEKEVLISRYQKIDSAEAIA